MRRAFQLSRRSALAHHGVAPAAPAVGGRSFHATPAPRVWPLIAGVGIATAAYAIQVMLRVSREVDWEDVRRAATGDDAGASAPSARSTKRGATARSDVRASTGGDSAAASTVLGIAVGDTSLRLALAPSTVAGGRIVETAEGQRALAAAYASTRDGQKLVGIAALRRRFEPGTAVVLCATTLLGEAADSEAASGCAQWLRDSAPVEADAAGRAALRVHHELLLPEQLSASLLDELRTAAASATGRAAWRAVLAVHAGASEDHRRAVRAAALDIGLLDVAIVCAPVAAFEAMRAAAAAAGPSMQPPGSPALVIHVGGRRASASLVAAAPASAAAPKAGDARVLASRQALFVGGEQHDEALVLKLADEFEAAHGIDLRTDHLALSRLLDAAEKARHELSTAASTVVDLPFITADASGPKHLRRELRRAELEAAADGMLRGFAIEELVKGALADAGLSAGSVGSLLLTGGMMRTPYLRARVERAVGLRAFESGLNPEDASALGAALPLFAPRAQAEAAEGAAEEAAA